MKICLLFVLAMFAQFTFGQSFTQDFNQVQSFYAKTNFQAAEMLCRTSLQRYPDAPKQDLVKVNLFMAVCVKAQGRDSEATKIYENIVDTFTPFLTNESVNYQVMMAKINIGSDYSTKGDYEKSLEYLLDAQKMSDKFFGHKKLLLSYLKLGKYEEALNVVFDPKNSFVSDCKTSFFETINNVAPRLIKKALLKNGLPVAGDAGKKEIEKRTLELMNALNAPMMGNVEEVLSGLGLPISKIDRTVFESYAKAIFKKVQDIESDPSDPAISGTLSLYLGVDEWNKFVKKYNGE